MFKSYSILITPNALSWLSSNLQSLVDYSPTPDSQAIKRISIMSHRSGQDSAEVAGVP